QNDSGLFETNLRDERYLPFEGAGAISSWRLEIPNDIPAFDPDTISDVILHIRYTAREAGHLKADAVETVKTGMLETAGSLLQLFCLNQDFGTDWQRFTSAANDNARKLAVNLVEDHFPYWARVLGMDDTITLSFCCIDWTKHNLSIAPKAVSVVRTPDEGWKAAIDKDSEVFAFLKKNMANKVYMVASYVTA